jgi:hypothetical protein
MRTPLVARGACAALLFSMGACGSDNGTGGTGPDDAAADGTGTDGGIPSPDGSSDGTAADAADAPGPPPKPPFDWVGVIGTGQSLSVGATAAFIDKTQPYGNLKLVDTGPDPKYPIEPDAGAPKWATVPLTEPLRAGVPGNGPGYGDGQYPDNIAGETPHSGMANTLTKLWKDRGGAGEYVTAQTAVGWSGHCLVDIDKQGGQRAYPAGINEMRVFHDLATAAGKTFGVGGIVLTHGECDAGNPMYAAGLFQLQQDYDTDLRAITGQTTHPVLFASQQSCCGGGPGGSQVQVWQAGVQHPGEVVCTGPKYQFGYSADHIHLPAPGYERLGQKYAEVFDLVVNQHLDWKPLQPNKATLAGATVTVAFDVPNPPLVFDDDRPKSQQGTPWANGRGFEVTDQNNTALTIASAAIQGSSVTLTLAQTPAPGSKLKVAYAITPDPNVPTAAVPYRGELRDSDGFTGWDAESISVATTGMSNVITAASTGGFVRRAAWDVVTGPNVPAGTVVVSHDSDDQLTLSQPVGGAGGTASFAFHHDESNYCVHFSMDVQ